MHGVGEDVAQVAPLAACVEHAVLGKKPILQVFAHVAPCSAQLLNTVFQALQVSLSLGAQRVEMLACTPQFGLHVLAFALHCGLFFIAHFCCRGASRVAFLLGFGHLAPHPFSFLRGKGIRFLHLFCRCGIFRATAYGGNLGVDCRNPGLDGLEMSTGLLRVEHRRHKPRPVVAAGEQSGIGGDEAQPCAFSATGYVAIRPHHEHAKHLAAALTAHHAAAFDVPLHLGGGFAAQRVRFVAERIGEFQGQRSVSMQCVEHIFVRCIGCKINHFLPNVRLCLSQIARQVAAARTLTRINAIYLCVSHVCANFAAQAFSAVHERAKNKPKRNNENIKSWKQQRKCLPANCSA